MTEDYLNYSWDKNRFGLSLDQGLIVAMEDEARWMIAENLTGGKNRSSYFDMIYEDGSRAVKPSADTIIR